jgi:SAM-dependent methyltransferase
VSGEGDRQSASFGMVDGEWEWDPSLYAGSARYYPVGRLPYPPEVAGALQSELALNGTGRLLDLGCGPGSLTLVLADLFEEVVGVDADAGMIEEAGRQARRLGYGSVRWICMRAEALPDGLGTFQVVTLAQSFHWMDQPQVAAILFDMLDSGGAAVHVGAYTHRGVIGGGDLPGPTPPRGRIADLVGSYLGPVRRAGKGVLPTGTKSGEDRAFEAAGFLGPRRVTVGGGQVFNRTEDEVVASVYSLSSAAPHLFADRLDDFDRDLRALLQEESPSGEFWERTEEIGLSIWRKK